MGSETEYAVSNAYSVFRTPQNVVLKMEYSHPRLNEPVTAIGGHYVLVKEERLPFRGREVLYLVGYAVIDTSCCGIGGYGYALVPGFVVEWKARTDDQGRPVSRIEPIRDEAVRHEVARLIRQREPVHQVTFGPD